MPHFHKGHGLGNDYIAVEPEELPFGLTEAAIRLICDRHRGVGSDGILARAASESADFGLRIFNPDGSKAEKSGNGLRIFGAYLLSRGEVEVGRPFTVETLGGTVTMTILGRDDSGVLQIEVEMGRASFSSAAVRLSGPDRDAGGEMLELQAGDRVAIEPVSLGNPHCVVFLDEIDPDDIRRRGPQIATHPWFEEGTNVQFARPVGGNVVEAWIWERGAGYTLASGSSACAVAAAAVKRGLVNSHQVEVRMPGGTLHVAVQDDWMMVLRGPVENVCVGEFAGDLLRRL